MVRPRWPGWVSPCRTSQSTQSASGSTSVAFGAPDSKAWARAVPRVRPDVASVGRGPGNDHPSPWWDSSRDGHDQSPSMAPRPRVGPRSSATVACATPPSQYSDWSATSVCAPRPGLRRISHIRGLAGALAASRPSGSTLCSSGSVGIALLLGLLPGHDVVIGSVFRRCSPEGAVPVHLHHRASHQEHAAGRAARLAGPGRRPGAAVRIAMAVAVLVIAGRCFASLDNTATAWGVPVTLPGYGFLVGATAAEATQAVGALLLLGLLAAPGAIAQRLTARPYGPWRCRQALCRPSRSDSPSATPPQRRPPASPSYSVTTRGAWAWPCGIAGESTGPMRRRPTTADDAPASEAGQNREFLSVSVRERPKLLELFELAEEPSHAHINLCHHPGAGPHRARP